MLLRKTVGAAFLTTGVLHFTHTRWYEAIMPPYVPAHREAVQVSGAAELIGGLAVVSPATRPAARWWLLALLVAVFPANLHMALHPDDVAGRGVAADRIPRWLLWARLPLQPLVMLWVWRATAHRD